MGAEDRQAEDYGAGEADGAGSEAGAGACELLEMMDIMCR